MNSSSSNFSDPHLGWQKNRPIRVAFLVEVSEHADLILDAIFADCYARWGGRFNLIIPCQNRRIVSDYWPWLNQYDPDVIYSYVELSDNDVLEIHETLAPADYHFHRHDGVAQPQVRDFRPQYNFSAMSSMSTIFHLARHRPTSQGPKVRILDSWHTEITSRFTLDNFGTYGSSALTGIFPNDAHEIASLMTIVSEEFWTDKKYGVPKDLDRIPSENSAYLAFVEGRATSMSMLSALYTGRAGLEDSHWGGSFNLVVGATFADRLLYWNARLLVPSWLDSAVCCFRINLDFIKEDVFIRYLAQMLNYRNHVKGSHQQAQLTIRSTSHSMEELEKVRSRLQDKKLWGPCELEVVPEGLVIPSTDVLRRADQFKGPFPGASIPRNTNEFRWTPPVAHPPHVFPDHLKDAPHGQLFTLGRWATDLAFEAPELHPKYGDNNIWLLPKRWRLANAFHTKFNMRGHKIHERTFTRTNAEGAITVFAGLEQVLEAVSIPTVGEALEHALCYDSANRQMQQGEPPWPPAKVQWMRPSNEANHLVGVIGLAGGLQQAQQLLLHPFLQKIFSELGGAPNLADTDIRQTVNALVKRSLGRPNFDLSQEAERQTLASWIVKAAQSIKAPRMSISLETLRKRWNEYRENYYAAHPKPVTGNGTLLDELGKEEERAIDKVLGLMRSHRMVFQGYPWKCDACQHRNWADFQSLKPSINCDVCGTETELPVGIPWHFRPNEFLIESLRSHSVLSLLWVLSALSNRSRSSFLYLEPTCFGYGHNYQKCDAEADLLVLIDGATAFCEVKSSWHSLRASDLADFVILSKKLRPDHAILAVMESGTKFEAEIQAVRAELKDVHITFELLTPDKNALDPSPIWLA